MSEGHKWKTKNETSSGKVCVQCGMTYAFYVWMTEKRKVYSFVSDPLRYHGCRVGSMPCRSKEER
jgi:hypothetical protein